MMKDTNKISKLHVNRKPETAEELIKTVEQMHSLNEIAIKGGAAEQPEKTVRASVDLPKDTHRKVKEYLKERRVFKKIGPWLVYLAEVELGIRKRIK